MRGVANRELTPELAFRLGRAAAFLLAEGLGRGRRRRAGAGRGAGAARGAGWRSGGAGRRPAVLVGRDPRLSGHMLEAALVAGICSVGADAVLAGVMTTPGIAYLTRATGVDAGVVISASHNPVEDNGIKFFSGDGFKLPDATEDAIADLVSQAKDDLPRPTGANLGRVHPFPEAARIYLDHVRTTVRTSLVGLRVVVDAANGAAADLTPRLLQELGAEVVAIGDRPDGTNINVGCGSTHPEAVSAAVVRHGAHVGIAHDGDADRCIACDERGEIVDGDQILAITGLHRHRVEGLPNRVVVATVLSNLGLELAFKRAGVRVVRTQVGDRYVLEEMLRSGAVLGGEQSGHLIFLDDNTTGDGLITALHLLAVMVETGQPLSKLAGVMPKLPQVHMNVRVKNRDGLGRSEAIAVAIEKAREKLGHTGRVIVRPSGTEPLVRVMVEGPDAARLQAMARELAGVIERELT